MNGFKQQTQARTQAYKWYNMWLDGDDETKGLKGPDGKSDASLHHKKNKMLGKVESIYNKNPTLPLVDGNYKEAWQEKLVGRIPKSPATLKRVREESIDEAVDEARSSPQRPQNVAANEWNMQNPAFMRARAINARKPVQDLKRYDDAIKEMEKVFGPRRASSPARRRQTRTGATSFGLSDMQISPNTLVKTIEGHYPRRAHSTIDEVVDRFLATRFA